MVRLQQTGGRRVEPIVALSHCVFPIACCVLFAGHAFGATINTEAAAPQRTGLIGARTAATPQQVPTIAIAAPKRDRDVNEPVVGDGIPDQRWGGSRDTVPRAVEPRVSMRAVTLPPIERVTPAPMSRPISISASEPVLTSIVRPQDVANFQKIGAPYQVAGTWYVPAHEPNYNETGVASWYGAEFHGRTTANGEIFDMNVVSGAHPTLPIPSLVEVTNLANGRSVVVRINDRGPFVSARLIDLSARGADLLGFRQQGQAQVRVRYVGPANREPVVTAENISTGQPIMTAASAAKSQLAFVQVGAFSQRANAERLLEQSSRLGHVRIVEGSQTDGTSLYRVVLGPVSSRNEANAKALEMSTNGFLGARVLASLN